MVTKKLQKLQSCKGVFVISKLSVKITAFVMSAITVLSVGVPVYAGSIHQDYTGAKAVMAGEAPLVQSTFDMMLPEKEDKFIVKVYDIGETVAKLKWSGNKVYLGYNICIFNPVTHNFEEYASTNASSITLTNLHDDSSYKFMISSAVSDETLGIVSFKTESLKPQLKIDEASSDGVKLTVGNVYDKAKFVLYRSDDGEDFEKIDVSKNEPSFVDENIKGNKQYYYKVKMISAHKDKSSDAVSVEVPENMKLPKVSGATKTYAYYTAVTAKTTPQYALLNSEECYTDEETGIRMIGDCYCVALGSFYGSTIGTKYRITFSTGKSINVILCDQKSDKHTDKKHRYAVKNGDIMEFYVEKGKVPSNIQGNYGNLEQFSGDIVKIERYAVETLYTTD